MRVFSKKLLWAIVLSALTFAACTKPAPIIVYGVTLSTNGVVFDALGGEKSISVTPFPEEEEWQIEKSDVEWVTIQAEEMAVRVVAQANNTQEPRTHTFTVVSPSDKFEPQEVIISQEATSISSGLATSAQESYEFDSEGGEYAFTVVANTEWDAKSDAEWLTVECDKTSGRVTMSASRNNTASVLEATVTISGVDVESVSVTVRQQTRDENTYYKLLGQWEITASTWFYTTNGSLNSLDYAPNPNDYCLIFTIEEGEYGKTLLMKDFLYPNTRLEVQYDREMGGFVIPFGWTVLSYDVFLYITVVSDRQFSYASLEVAATLSEDGTTITLDMPTVSGFNHVGFGLWTYDENDNKEAFGSNYRPTMYPMDNIVLRKYTQE